MTSITIPLADADWVRLQAVATRLGRTPEELALAGIEGLLQRTDTDLRAATSLAPTPARGENRQVRAITELEGLGRDVWRGIDAQEYVHRERDAWGG
jgi:hypothetical protein